jgi:hypothetical protein
MPINRAAGSGRIVDLPQPEGPSKQIIWPG